MVSYKFDNDKYVITDYQNAKTFANFLPAIAGVDGKPLWAFYANVGQVMAGFGVNNKDTPITPFDSANQAYMNISTRSFRTFIKEEQKLITPFFKPNETQILQMKKTDVTISEEIDGIKYEINYTTIPHKNYAGLVRNVKITNLTNTKRNFEILDGLPIIFPNGLSNYCYKELVSLMAAYCQVDDLDKNRPFIKFKTSTADNSVVEESNTGNGFFSIDEHQNTLATIVDLKLVFANDKALLEPQGFLAKSFDDFKGSNQQTENKLPCAFTLAKCSLGYNESYSFATLYGMFDNKDIFDKAYNNSTYESLVLAKEENEKLMDELLKPSYVKTGDNLFDNYVKQSFLDNNLRGGFAQKLPGTDEVYYVYSRKHGDMERDYNSFQIPSRYYSSGQGNFRDVNQNRRNDLYFYPFVKDYNIRLFFELIQGDGQNPLNVKPLVFKINDNLPKNFFDVINSPLKENVLNILKSFEPSHLYTLLKDNSEQLNEEPAVVFSKIINNSTQEIEANFAEGYWIDHWTYNVDLLENFESVYPDKIEELLLKDDYKYFYSPVYVEPRNEKYCYISEGKIRQYGAINLKKIKEKEEKYGFDSKKTDWLKTKNNEVVKTTLLNKIFSLILIKFSTLDSMQLGIEMECEKPGWNDAMNGLPGLCGSALSETVELLRLLRFAKNSLNKISVKEFNMLQEQYDFYISLSKSLEAFLNKEIDSFTYWDNATTAREEYRKAIEIYASGKQKSIKVNSALDILTLMEAVLIDGIKEAKKIGNGIIPSYLIYEMTDYQKTGYINHLGYETVKAKSFKLVTIPPFLEATARVLKLGKEFYNFDDYNLIKSTDIYDEKLGVYKTCASIDDAPFEIGRVHAFTKGWLERECNFLHMTYKYLLGLLKAGFYKEFYNEIKKNFPVYMDPYVYGRNVMENSSFIVPTCNPDSSLHGQGFFARLTGANAEVMNMVTIMFLGDSVFEYKNNELVFKLAPKLSKELFDKDNIVKFRLFAGVDIIYHNDKLINTYEAKKLTYKINNKLYDNVCGDLALDIRNGKINQIDVFIEE